MGTGERTRTSTRTVGADDGRHRARLVLPRRSPARSLASHTELFTTCAFAGSHPMGDEELARMLLEQEQREHMQRMLAMAGFPADESGPVPEGECVGPVGVLLGA